MILRRIIDAFRQQDWFTVLVEIMIVVMGVFLGLQVNNWNEARQDRAREALYLERLHADVETALATTLQLGDRVARRVAEADRVSDAVYGRDRSATELDAQSCESIARLHIFYVEGYALPTLEELIASGRFDLIRDQRLLQVLSDYLSFVRALSSRAEAVSERAPILPQQFPNAIAMRSSVSDGVRTPEYQCNLTAMQTDPGFLNAFTEVRQRASFFQATFLAPERSLVDRVHTELDRVLAITHQDEPKQ